MSAQHYYRALGSEHAQGASGRAQSRERRVGASGAHRGCFGPGGERVKANCERVRRRSLGHATASAEDG